MYKKVHVVIKCLILLQEKQHDKKYDCIKSFWLPWEPYIYRSERKCKTILIVYTILKFEGKKSYSWCP